MELTPDDEPAPADALAPAASVPPSVAWRPFFLRGLETGGERASLLTLRPRAARSLSIRIAQMTEAGKVPAWRALLASTAAAAPAAPPASAAARIAA